MPDIRAADIAKRRLAISARRLGTRNPVESIGGLIDRTFDLPLGDPRYGNNALLPGSLALEHSFSEVANGSLRLDLEPLGPDASPISRRHETSREVRRLVDQNYGRGALQWFDRQSETWRANHIHGNARFGAWFGAGFDETGLQEAKAYYELAPGQLDALPPNLLHASRIAMACLPGLEPIFVSVACGRSQGAVRVHFYHRGDLRLLELEPMMHRLGIGHQLPSLLTSVGLILGGRFVLAEGSVILGLRDTTRGLELKLDVLIPGVADPPREMHGLIQMLLAERPENARALHNWLQAMTPDSADTAGDICVVSVRVNPAMGGRLTLYFRPVGYDRVERDAFPASGRDPFSTHRRDPYALNIDA